MYIYSVYVCVCMYVCEDYKLANQKIQKLGAFERKLVGINFLMLFNRMFEEMKQLCSIGGFFVY